jgi:hypothetical protein
VKIEIGSPILAALSSSSHDSCRPQISKRFKACHSPILVAESSSPSHEKYRQVQSGLSSSSLERNHRPLLRLHYPSAIRKQLALRFFDCKFSKRMKASLFSIESISKSTGLASSLLSIQIISKSTCQIHHL